MDAGMQQRVLSPLHPLSPARRTTVISTNKPHCLRHENTHLRVAVCHRKPHVHPGRRKQCKITAARSGHPVLEYAQLVECSREHRRFSTVLCTVQQPSTYIAGSRPKIRAFAREAAHTLAATTRNWLRCTAPHHNDSNSAHL